MSAKPIQPEDPNDPAVILRSLPKREHAQFLRQYQHAVDAAHDPDGYQQLRRLLHAWSLAVIAMNQPGYYEAMEAVRSGTARTVPIDEAIPGWRERLAVLRAQAQ